MSGAFLDMMGAQSTSVAANAFETNSNARQKAANKRRSYVGRSAATAAIHGRNGNSIASVSANLYKSFRERFMSNSEASDYRALRQRDAEAGKQLEFSEGSSDEEGLQNMTRSNSSSISSSSVEDLFVNEAERRQYRRKLSERQKNTRRRRGKMGQRTGASASCEDLVLEISLPDEQMAADKMTLTLHEKEVDLGTTLYRLRLPLPHSVDVDRCQAKYDKELGKLRLTLRLRRELDYVNF